ncbi:sulfite exporter TauE/SafE family protein [Nostoc sp.]|uniref:sulfite exporter TauE/SafE family protein n=1 Tax=Nostoc sp. TaxID=1180 RepID=UPI002FF7011C
MAALASAGAYRQDLGIERRDFLLLCGVSLVGGMIGSIALLYTSPDVFKKLIPYLLLLATVVFTFSEPFKKWLQCRNQNTSPESVPLFNLLLAQLAIAIYDGFFGAGLGILMLATLTFLGIKSIHKFQKFSPVLHRSGNFSNEELALRCHSRRRKINVVWVEPSHSVL